MAPFAAEPDARLLDEVLLYDLTDSPFCAKARICLQLKDVAFRRVTLTVGRRRELRRLNPLGKVPVLVDRGVAIADSSRIARHLEADHPEPALIPVGTEARAYAGLLEEWADEALYPIVGAFKWLNPQNRAAALANTVDEMAPPPLRPLVGGILVRTIRRRLAAWGYTEATLPETEARMVENLDTLASLLAGKDFLLGRVPTIADVAVFAQLAWMERYVERRLIGGAPDVGAWLQRLATVPAVAGALAS